MIGKTISHYQILEKLGEGGMGVVYKARDTHLDRFVAVKILPPEKIADPERKKRFVQEAKAASSLNHPNIITIHDIDQQDGIDFIAMEFVAGKTLDRLIPRHGMRLNEALKTAVQMADALARAHGAGIIHRDLKPANVMIDDHGMVKVLDFGLAKLTETLPTSEDDPTLTVKPTTEEGTIVGTVCYMSPEQAEGKKVDARSDIFSFGSVLYEMFTGRRAFQGETRASTIAAILKEEPKPLRQVAENLPREVERIVKRCLRKDAGHRWQIMADLKVALEELREESDSGTLVNAPQPLPKRRRNILWAVLLAGIVAIGVRLWWVTQQHPQAQLVISPLTTFPGDETHPSFSPDGNQIAFAWNGPKQDNYDIYIKMLGTETLFRLTSDPAPDGRPAWSPDGRSIAFMRILPNGNWGIFLISAIGGPERKLTELKPSFAHLLAWSPDGKWLVFSDEDSANQGRATWSIYAFSVVSNEKRRLTTNSTIDGDIGPSISPDGRNLVFSRRTSQWHSELYRMALQQDLSPVSEPRQITFQGRSTDNPVWTPDGGDIIYLSSSDTSKELWRISSSDPSTPRRLDFAGGQVAGVAISRHGNRLVYRQILLDDNIWRFELHGPGGKAGKPAKLISSTWNDEVADYSPDGSQIVFISGRTGQDEVWICRSDGSNPVQLTSVQALVAGCPRWSPDGKRIGFDSNAEGNFEVYVVDAGGGTPRRLTKNPADDVEASFSRDGRWIWFTSNRSGRKEIWKMSTEGSEPIQATRNGGEFASESLDGKHLYFCREDKLWRSPVEGGNEELIVENIGSGTFALSGRGVYFIRPGSFGGGGSITFLDFSTRKETTLAVTPQAMFVRLSLSPDEQYLLYTQVDQFSSDLMLVENFK
jgi:Tol biopolymer transport system component/predicted Ser/Thr protein kinase